MSPVCQHQDRKKTNFRACPALGVALSEDSKSGCPKCASYGLLILTIIKQHVKMKQFSFRSGHPGSVIKPAPGKLQLHDVLAQKSLCWPCIISSLTVLICNMNYLNNMKATFLPIGKLQTESTSLAAKSTSTRLLDKTFFCMLVMLSFRITAFTKP